MWPLVLQAVACRVCNPTMHHGRFQNAGIHPFKLVVRIIVYAVIRPRARVVAETISHSWSFCPDGVPLPTAGPASTTSHGVYNISGCPSTASSRRHNAILSSSPASVPSSKKTAIFVYLFSAGRYQARTQRSDIMIHGKNRWSLPRWPYPGDRIGLFNGVHALDPSDA